VTRTSAPAAPPPAPPRLRPGQRWALALLGAGVAVAWAGVVHLLGLPDTDAAGRPLLHTWRGRTSTWWSSGLLEVALLASLTLLGRVLWLGVRRLRGPWRWAAAALGATVWTGAAAYAVVWGFLVALLTGFAGTSTVVHGAGGVTRLVTQDGFDGDTVLVWRPVGRTTWVLESSPAAGPSSLDPRQGLCSIETRAPARAAGPARPFLVCGSTSQPLGWV